MKIIRRFSEKNYKLAHKLAVHFYYSLETVHLRKNIQDFYALNFATVSFGIVCSRTNSHYLKKLSCKL